VGQQARYDVFRQEVLEDDVGKGLGEAVLTRQGFADLARLLRVQFEACRKVDGQYGIHETDPLTRVAFQYSDARKTLRTFQGATGPRQAASTM
jgi:hypothetical protein